MNNKKDLIDKLKLYLVTDRKIAKLPLTSVIREALRGGVRAVQLREKDLSSRELYDLAKKIRKITREKKALFFINDRIDIALAAGADGVHLGWQSVPADKARKLTGNKFIIGVSTHSLKEALRAQKEGADYITFGPVYQTPSKEGLVDFKGPGAVKRVREKINIPLIAIGGIKEVNARDVVLMGADGIAVISAIMADGKPYMAARRLVDEL
ncbi:MAG: thiamine-phosphate diphosphorylase [Candidatus Schekmanbacteria bacterium RBG_16_38_11]|uniref:Thiamine-phosphate synthase n=2 Tax=Candidatus Schekmaniibacteriota TaxID=1817811 RepID=A0A1F7R9U3_9BACT|nr:MAG: thiamine-phosphate diphosphorylase [Candidatus Schekmanbacteria bacterium GWA2_38_11]OGL45032.1 MAG: thiamine-phosphate diphosphorylase [Candidatus Schekmanbacteria bacterium RBG_16_38_11]